MGRPPKPTSLKKLQGNPGHRALPANEPQPRAEIPTRPGWLSAEGKREWTRLAPELHRLGLLTTVDRAEFAVFCESWGLYVEAIKDIRDHGTTFVTDKGYEGPRPSVGIMVKMVAAMDRIGRKFGLAPADRAKLSVAAPEEESEFEKFLSAKRRQIG